MNNLASNSLKQQRQLFIIVLVLAVFVNLAGVAIRFFTDDPALYAVLARTMVQTGNFADLVYRGHDWLDKPHFPFWMVALSFKAFGIRTVTYKLPALLFYLMGVLYTYKLAKKFYGLEVALVAALILLTAQHTMMSNTDVRAEPYIMGLLMGAVYHFYKVKERFSFADLLLASLFTACAVMTKGIYLLIPIGSAIIGDYLFKKDFKGLLQWRWLLACLLVALFTLPEVYTLYTQFDQHPEKVVFGHTGISGIHWFLWDSQFGRFNNNGFIRNTHGSKFFFLHTLLWAFAPWAIVFFYALIRNIRNLFKGVAQPEYLCVSGGVLMLLIFSVSKFQLPFYTNILFPFFSIILAGFVTGLKAGTELRFFKVTQYIISGLLVALLIALNFVFAPGYWGRFSAVLIVIAALLACVAKAKLQTYQPAFLVSCIAAIGINLYFILVVYPVLVSYKGDVQAAYYINGRLQGQPVVSTVTSNRLDFYSKSPIIFANVNELSEKTGKNIQYFLIDEASIRLLDKKQVDYSLLHIFDNYPSENLSLPFIIKKDRYQSLNHFYLIRLNK